MFDRDNYTCKCCNAYGGQINAHHINNYATNEELRFDTDNGITLCKSCHKLFHSKYGYLNTNEYQLNDFISTYGKNIV